MRSRLKYEEISKAQITDTRNVVISNCSEGGFTIAQQLVAKEDDKETTVFLRGAFHVDDVNGLLNLRDAINLAITHVNEKSTDDSEWDD